MLKLGKRQSRPTMYLYITLYNLLLKIVAISCKPWIISFWTCPDEIEKHKILFWKSLHHWPKSCSQNSKHLKPSPSSLNKNLPMHRIPAKSIKDGITTRIQCLQAVNHANDPMIRHHPICILLQVQIASWTQYDAPSACNCGPFTNLDITAILPQTARGGGAAGSRGSLSTRP